MLESQTPALRALYQEVIMRHYHTPTHCGDIEGPHREVRISNITCGDTIVLRLRVDGRRIDSIGFTGDGCAISQASASMMADLVDGRTVDECQALGERFKALLRGDPESMANRSLGDLRALAGVAQFPARVRCAMLAWDALDKLIGSGGEITAAPHAP